MNYRLDSKSIAFFKFDFIMPNIHFPKKNY